VARKLRIQFEGALYHVINRGNYRRDLFETAGAAEAFLTVLFEATVRYGWRLHAFVLMRNHCHLALETPQANLVEGMHWLQSTIATRFNRYRQERGHLFQGRYQAVLVEDFAVLGRVVDYIHLNPVRARVIPADQVANFRWSILRRFVRGPRPAGMVAAEWLEARGGWKDTAEGWRAYVAHLIGLGQNEAEQKRQGLERRSSAWALGTHGWRQAVARDHTDLRLSNGLERDQARALNEARWSARLSELLKEAERSAGELESRPLKQLWKLQLANKLRREVGASITWIALTLNLGRPASLRSYLSRMNQQTAA
jgi:REP element-mobilizing transposase RayT